MSNLSILILPFLFAVQTASSSPQLPVVIAPTEQGANALTVDGFLKETFRKSENSYFDQASGKFVIKGKLSIPVGKFAPSEHANLKILVETGQWTTASGQPFDLRNAAMTFPDGKGGLADMMDYFFSDEFAQILRDPFGINYPPSPYVSGMSAGEYVEALIKSLGREHFYLDGETGAIVVPSLNIPLHDLDSAFCVEVVTIIMSGKIWISPNGVPFDFSKTAFTIPTTEIGTPEQRRIAKETRARLVTDLYKYLDDSISAKKPSRRDFFSTMNTSNSEPLPNSLLDRIKDIKLMKPVSCQQDLSSKAQEK